MSSSNPPVLVLLVSVIFCPDLWADDDSNAKNLSPQETVQAFEKAIKNQEVGNLYRLLPNTYQDKLQTMVRRPINAVDAQVWEKFVALVKKTGLALKNKAPIITGKPTDYCEGTYARNAPKDPEALKKWREKQIAHGKKMCKMISTSLDIFTTWITGVANDSRFRKHSKAKALELGPFLDKHGKGLMDYINQVTSANNGIGFFDAYQNMKIEKADTANPVVIYQYPGVKREGKIILTKIDGKWIPVSVRDNFVQYVEQGDAFMKLMLRPSIISKEKIIAKLDEIDKTVDQFNNTKNYDELSAVVKEAFAKFVMR